VGVTVRDRYTIAEAAELTGLSKGALARRIERGQLPATKEGRLRYIAAGDLAAAGLLNPSTGAPPTWAGRVESSAIAREIVKTVIQQSVELHELRQQLRALLEESRRDDVELRTEIERARTERRELRRTLEAARTEISELRSAPVE
jgi:excisionase family DNA binding protein